MIKGLKNVWYSITSPEKYREFMNHKLRHLFLHVIILVLISAFFTAIIPALKFLSTGGFGKMINEEIPEFHLSSDQGFWIAEPVLIDEYNVYIEANSDLIKEDIRDFSGSFGSYDYVIIVDQQKLYMKMSDTQEFIVHFDELQDKEFTKKDFLSVIPVMYVVVVLVFLIATLVDFGYYFMVAFVTSWFAGIIASFMNIRLGGKKIYYMTIYAGTTSYFVGMLQMFFMGETIKNYTFFSMVITLGYLYFALKDYKENCMEEIPPREF